MHNASGCTRSGGWWGRRGRTLQSAVGTNAPASAFWPLLAARSSYRNEVRLELYQCPITAAPNQLGRYPCPTFSTAGPPGGEPHGRSQRIKTIIVVVGCSP